MLKIRLARFGTKNAPTYRLVISERTKDTFGDVLEYLGTYNPRVNPKAIDFKADRIQYWLSRGAQPSPTVHNMLVDKGIIKDKKITAFKLVKKAEEKKAPVQGGPASGGETPVAAPAVEEKKEEPVPAVEKTEPAPAPEIKEEAEAPKAE